MITQSRHGSQIMAFQRFLDILEIYFVCLSQNHVCQSGNHLRKVANGQHKDHHHFSFDQPRPFRFLDSVLHCRHDSSSAHFQSFQFVLSDGNGMSAFPQACFRTSCLCLIKRTLTLVRELQGLLLSKSIVVVLGQKLPNPLGCSIIHHHVMALERAREFVATVIVSTDSQPSLLP